jgi:lipid II:glycine glycyltransferase (peptidoglycan interpeptide bridge formation enzyme)
MHFKTSESYNFNGLKNQANQTAAKYGVTNQFKTKLIKFKTQFFHKPVVCARSDARNVLDIFTEYFVW